MSRLLVVSPSKVSENLVNFYFTGQWLILRISNVTFLKFFKLNRKFKKCFGKTDSSNLTKQQQLQVRGHWSSEKSIRNFVKFGFARKIKMSENLVNFYFTGQWLILRITNVTFLKFFKVNRKFEKRFGKTDS